MENTCTTGQYLPRPLPDSPGRDVLLTGFNIRSLKHKLRPPAANNKSLYEVIHPISITVQQTEGTASISAE